MADEIAVRAQRRDVTGKQVRRLRAQGMTPGNISGGGQPSVAIQMDERAITDLLKHHGTPLLRITLDPSGDACTALLARVERDAVSTAVLHVDFRRVELSQPIKAHVTLHVEGEAPATKLYGGVLLHLTETIEVEALPGNLPDALVVDVSGMQELNSTLTAADIKVPAGVRLLVAQDEPIITIKPPRIETPEETAVAAGEETPMTAETTPSDSATSGDQAGGSES